MIWNINPVLFELGPFEIRYYGIFFALSLVLAYSLGRKMCRIKKLNLEDFDQLVFYLVVGAILGARFGHILFYNLSYYIESPLSILKIWEGGLSSHGGGLGLLLAYFLFLKFKKKIKFSDHGDILSVLMAFPIIFVRLGNFFNSEILGRTSDLPWAIEFSRIDNISRHPTQLYEALIGLILLATLYPLWKKNWKSWSAQKFVGIFFTLYFGLRFLSEFTKDLAIQEGLLNLTTGQLLSVPFVLTGVWMVRKS